MNPNRTYFKSGAMFKRIYASASVNTDAFPFEGTIDFTYCLIAETES